MYPHDAPSSLRGSSEIEDNNENDPYGTASTSSGSAGMYDKFGGLKRGMSSSSLRSFGQQSHASSFQGEMAGFAIIEVKDFDDGGGKGDGEPDAKDDVLKDQAAKEPAPPPAKLAKLKECRMTPCAWATSGLCLLVLLIAGVAVIATMGTIKRSSSVTPSPSPSPPMGFPSPGFYKSPQFARTASFVRLAPPSNGYFPDPSFNTSGPIDWYQSNWDSIAMVPSTVGRFFSALAKLSRKSSLAGRLPVTNTTMLLYMRSVEPQFPNAIQAYRNFLMNGNQLPAGSLPANVLSNVFKEAEKLLDSAGPADWMDSLYTADAARQQLLEGSYLANLTAAAQAALKNVTATYPSPPYTPAPLETRISSAFSTEPGSTSGVTLRPPGFRFFNFLTIPIVFHSLMYVEGSNTLQPATAYWSTQPFDSLIAQINALFDASYTRIRFKLQEVRTDPALYPYLLMGEYADWQKCASQGPDCISLLAADNNIDPTTTINIWTAGTLARRSNTSTCANCTLGYAWQPPYQFTDTADSSGLDDTGMTGTEAFRQQHVYLNWDVIDSTFMNSASLWQMGASVAARYLGRHLGLGNVLPKCGAKKASAGAAAPDLSKWFAKADNWCAKAQAAGHAGRTPDWKSLPEAAPCGKPSLESVFDIMNPVTPPACARWFSPNATFGLQALVYKERPILYSQQSGSTQAP